MNQINYYGLSAVFSQLTGFLFLENVKMEKQRTDMSYRRIIPHFLTPRTFISGFFPYGMIQAYSKGFIFGMNQSYIKPYLSRHISNSHLQNVGVGLTTGITEALLTSPLLYARLHVNKNLVEGSITNITNNTNIFRLSSLPSIFKGVNVLIAKRTIDWSSRLVLIDAVAKSSTQYGIESKTIHTFIGASISSVFSAPVDRLLPIIYTKQSISKILKNQGLSFFYKGFVCRCLSTAHYTTFLLVFPDYLRNLNKK